MLMMLALRLTSLNPSNHWEELLHCGRGFNGGENGQRAGKHIQLMLMMLALRFNESVEWLRLPRVHRFNGGEMDRAPESRSS